jgi:hypothetical protein
VVIGALAQDHEAQAGSFFGSGVFALTALLALVWSWMRRTGHIHRRAVPGLALLGLRNAARHPVRSILTIGLLAAATFLLVAVQAFHRDPDRDFLSKSGGSGGYAWVAESTVPIFQDLNTPAGRAAVGLPADINAQFVAFRVRPGDDASCLNLYQPRQPRILGVPQELIERGGFRFAEVIRPSPNPWQLLLARRPYTPDDVSVIGEANTVKWILKGTIGQIVGPGPIVALLEDSVFQGDLLISEENFLKNYPRQEGFQFFLIDAPQGPQGDVIRRRIETALADYGFSMTPAQERLQAYLDVENTYLATFQALGGLGLLLGTLGLAVVLVRSVWERRGELALLRALGFRRWSLGLLVLAEHIWLLGLGLAIGCIAALIAVAPYLITQAGTVLQPQLGLLLALVAVVGLAAGALAVWTTLRTPLLPALRRE